MLPSDTADSGYCEVENWIDASTDSVSPLGMRLYMLEGASRFKVLFHRSSKRLLRG